MTEPTADITAFHIGQKATVVTALSAYCIGTDPTVEAIPDHGAYMRGGDTVTVVAVMDGPTENLYQGKYNWHDGTQPATDPGEGGGVVIVRDAYGSWWHFTPAALNPKPPATGDAGLQAENQRMLGEIMVVDVWLAEPGGDPASKAELRRRLDYVRRKLTENTR